MFETGSKEDPSEEEGELPAEDTAAEEEGESSGGSSDFDSFADLALDTQLPMSERRKALKEAIMACMGSDYSEESDSGEGKSSLAAIFGG